MPLVISLLTMLLVAALASAIAILAGMEARLAGAYRAGAEAIYAADAAVERAIEELRHTADWDAVLDGRAASAMVFGPAEGIWHSAAGVIDVGEATVLGGWRLYARGDLRQMLPEAAAPSASYVAVWVARPPGGEPDRLAVLGHAHGPGGVRRAIEVRIARDGPPPGLRWLTWREVR